MDIQKITKIAIINVMQLKELVVVRIGRIVANQDNVNHISMVMFVIQDCLFRIAQRHDKKYYTIITKHFSAKYPLIYFFYKYFGERNRERKFTYEENKEDIFCSIQLSFK